MASYIENTLEPGEKIIYKGRLHWTYNFKYTCPGFLAFVCGIVGTVYSVFSSDADSGDTTNALTVFFLILTIVGIAITLWGYFIRSKSEFAITDTRFIQKEGILNVKMTEIPLFKIETINFYQSLFERICGTGKIELVGSGGTDHTVSFLQQPHQVRKIIMANMKKNKED